MYDMVMGRSEKDRKKLGTEGAIFLGRHYVKMGQRTALSNKIFMDVTTSHVLFICGKRGSGKSYTMGVIAEGMSDLPSSVKNNVAVVMLDTMGIYWTMKYPNEKEAEMLKEWELEPKGLQVTIYTPTGYFKKYKEDGIPTDFPFSVKPNELEASNWCLAFDLSIGTDIGVVIERTINELRDEKADYDLDDIIKKVKSLDNVKAETKEAVANRFISAKKWGLFSKEGTPITDLVKGGQVTVLDVSCYATIPGASGIRALVIGLVSEKLFLQRMIVRKQEEYGTIKKKTSLLDQDEEKKKREPLVWLIIDEAHEFLPKEGQTAASQPLITILREGRQPGISLILATQQPGKIHTDVMTQSDMFLSHRLTANYDTQALSMLMQSYMGGGLDKELNNLPRSKGSALAFDDNNERLFPLKIRPRFTWHGGSSPSAFEEKRTVFNF
jgi:hypothetical protein